MRFGGRKMPCLLPQNMDRLRCRSAEAFRCRRPDARDRAGSGVLSDPIGRFRFAPPCPTRRNGDVAIGIGHEGRPDQRRFGVGKKKRFGAGRAGGRRSKRTSTLCEKSIYRIADGGRVSSARLRRKPKDRYCRHTLPSGGFGENQNGGDRRRFEGRIHRDGHRIVLWVDVVPGEVSASPSTISRLAGGCNGG